MPTLLPSLQPPLGRFLRAAALAASASLALASSIAGDGEPAVAGQPGGRVVAALRAEPKTFNPVTAVDSPSLAVLRRLHADLVHIDRASQGTVPALAESWTVSQDGRRYRLKLRRGVRFSDGRPLDAADVVFTFRVHLDPAVGSPSRETMIVGGEPISVRKIDRHTLEVEMARPYATAERLFDGISILPEHRLGDAYRQGRLATSWGLATPAAEIVGLGPFRLRRYVPGERVELERNPYYWKVDGAGERQPYLEALTFLFVANEEAQALRFRAGETDVIDGLSAESYDLLAAEGEREYRLHDLGPGLASHFLFFNLNELGEKELPAIERKQSWFRRRAFRQAISLAADREAIARLVYRGRATPLWGPESPGNRAWALADLPRPRRSPERARELLRSAGFRWNDDGELLGPEGDRVRFSVVTNSSSRERVAMATLLQEDLAEIGIALTVVPLEFRALLDRVLDRFDYEACLLGLGSGDGDPNTMMPVWLSSGANHLWHLGQARPATPWEAELDRLMRRQLTEIDPEERRALYEKVQRIVVEEQPLTFLVSPNVLVGAHRDLGGFRPAVLEHHTLWNAEELFWRRPGGEPKTDASGG